MLLYIAYIFEAAVVRSNLRCFDLSKSRLACFHNIITSNNVDKYMHDYYNAIRFYSFRYFTDIVRPKFPGAGRESGV